MATNGPAAIVACWEQLHEAVLELATRCATPRQRLLAVAERQLLVVAELGAKLDDRELREWISRLARRLQGTHNAPTRSAVFATVNAMSDEDVDAILLDIISIYDEVTRAEVIERVRSAAAA
ncbi:MAG TPA: hypothetical protein VNZ50_02445 [Hyphomicrobiaceae bacterium]|nr:hypothetical protein [Hyphomicrobiaceae bacterium]